MSKANRLPKISVITPSYNQGQFIEETILSVINQEYPDIEYIIVDGGSSDDSVKIIEKYNKYLTYWVSERDSGQSEAINKGFRRASGDIVCWINSDDILMPGALNKVGAYFQNNKDSDVVNGYTIVIDEKSNILYNFFILRQRKWYAQRGIYYVAQPSMFWRRKLLDELGFLREDFHAQMDKEMLIRFFEKNLKVGQIKKILAGFRSHEASKSSVRGPIWARDLAEIGKMYGARYGQKHKIVHRCIYGLEKFFRGVYFEKWIFIKKWRGKNVRELSTHNCHYL